MYRGNKGNRGNKGKKSNKGNKGVMRRRGKTLSWWFCVQRLSAGALRDDVRPICLPMGQNVNLIWETQRGSLPTDCPEVLVP